MTGAGDPALAATIRQLRKDQGITREALAYQSGLTTGALARIELAEAVPRWSSVRKVARALGLPISRIALTVEAVEAEGRVRDAD